MKTYKHFRKISRVLFGLFGVSLLLFSSCAKEKDCKCGDDLDLLVTIKQGKCEDVELSMEYGSYSMSIKCE
ncbi:MAG: hypothetical protein JXB49_36790 [Bacteroidales bacterium]|nr:hypothetical protein [Bacteroidales bacterium]